MSWGCIRKLLCSISSGHEGSITDSMVLHGYTANMSAASTQQSLHLQYCQSKRRYRNLWASSLEPWTRKDTSDRIPRVKHDLTLARRRCIQQKTPEYANIASVQGEIAKEGLKPWIYKACSRPLALSRYQSLLTVFNLKRFCLPPVYYLFVWTIPPQINRTSITMQFFTSIIALAATATGTSPLFLFKGDSLTNKT